MHKAFVLLSGGMDSTTCLHKAIADCGYDTSKVEAVSIDYGQRHLKETQYAAGTCKKLGVQRTLLPCTSLASDAMLTNPDTPIPSIDYADIKGVSPTYVPFRNGTLLAVITAHAQKWVNAQVVTAFNPGEIGVYFGAHAEDAANWAYPDCTPEFIGAMANAIYIGTYRAVRLITPLQWLTKKEIVRLGNELHVNWKGTWSCLAKGTEIRTLAGLEPIEKIKPGRWVWGFDEIEKRWVPSLVEALLYQGVKEVYEIELKDGAGRYKSKFCATADHRLMLRGGGYARVDQLDIGSRLMPASPEATYVTKKGRDGVGYYLLKPHNFWDEPPVYMHRYVADFFGMNMNGVIHHGKEGTFNNDPSNLTAMSLGEHTKHHISEQSWKDINLSDEVNARRRQTVANQWASMSPEEYEQRVLNIRKARQAQAKRKREQNHVVLSIKKIGEQPTYDLQTSTENFALGAGIFVHNCYAGGEKHCGVCPTCRARKTAFKQAEVSDPTVYAE